MSKPLELTIYPLDLSFPAGYVLPRDSRVTFRAANRIARDKRLTDAELAAEYHGQAARVALIEDSSPHNSAGPSAYRKLETLHRFATLPHHDELQP
jgi:hypothetical protein